MKPVARSKIKQAFVCQACGHHSLKWLGRCPACSAWSTLVEEVIQPVTSQVSQYAKDNIQALRLCDISEQDYRRESTGLPEFDRVLGGGLVHGSLVLVGGDPGIGKSTLLLQAAGSLAGRGLCTLYVTAEESLGQVKLRAERLGVDSGCLYLLAETHLEAVDIVLQNIKPRVLIIDSIQTVGCADIDSSIGSVGQIRAATARLMDIAKVQGISTFIIGHVTKEGAIAGPKVMEHMVDTVLYFEGERTGSYRILRAHKNRFGSAQEIGVFEMQADGLHTVVNPSALFLAQRSQGAGAVAVTLLEGSRPIVLEVQALVIPTFHGGTPRRSATGFDPQRVSMLCAVLAARAHIDLGTSDVFVNVAGGVKISEPAADLGVALALASAAKNRPISEHMVVIGELGLSGDIRAANQVLLRLREAEALGFKYALIPHIDVEQLKTASFLHMGIKSAKHIKDALAVCRIMQIDTAADS